jgi:predicted Zn-dependent protease with MMP-like domain
MRLSDFESLVRRLSREVPAHFFDGVAEVVVSPRAVPHPDREEVYTLGECIPLPLGESAVAGETQSRIVLYHGSFMALARLRDDFDWREEAWETLTHELRHHREWCARAPDLEALDWAVEQNFARQDGERFDCMFLLEGEEVAPGVYQVEDDLFLDQLVRDRSAETEFEWRGRRYRLAIPPQATLPAFLSVEGVTDPPAGQLVVVLRRKPGFLSLLRPAVPYQAALRAESPGSRPGTSPKGSS